MFDTESLAIKAWCFVFAKMGYQNVQDIASKAIGLDETKTKGIFLEFFGKGFDFETAKTGRVNYVIDYVAKNGMPVKPGLYQLIDFLEANDYRITIATSTKREIVDYYLRNADLTKHFPNFISGDMVEHGKPHPEIYLKACEILDISPDNCLALEDSPYGITSAYRAGMKSVMIPDLLPPTTETEEKTVATLNSLVDVIALLKINKSAY